MSRIVSILLAIFILSACTTKVLVKTKTEIKVTEKTLIDSVVIADSVDLTKYKDWDIAIIDSMPVVIEMPKHIEYPEQIKTIKTRDNRDINIRIKTTVDSGRVKTTITIPEITEKDTTIKITEVEDHTRTYVKWLIVIVVMFLSVVIFVLIRR